MKLSISRAWEEAATFLRQEQRLLLPVALAFLLLPALVASLTMPFLTQSQPNLPIALLGLAMTIVRMLGYIIITRLALGTHDSLGTTTRTSLRRLSPMLVLFFMVLLPASVVGAPFTLMILRSPTAVPPGALLGLLVVMLAVLVVFVRLSLSVAVAVAEPGGAIAIAKRSFSLTRGNFWRLFGFILLLLITMLILTKIVQVVVGSLLILVLGPPKPWTVSQLLLLASMQLVGVTVTVALTVMLARLYVQRAVVSGVPSTAA